MNTRHLRRLRRSLARGSFRQGGATAIEFAFVFPILFAVTYATIVYSYVYFVQQSLNLMAEQALRAAVSVDPGAAAASAYDGNMTTAAAAAASLFKDGIATPAIKSSSVTTSFPTLTSVRVTVTVPSISLGISTIPLFFNVPFPPLPAALTASATASLT